MKKTFVLTLMATAIGALASVAQAQTAPAEPESTLAFNAGVVSDYRYRGISQSRCSPLCRGGWTTPTRRSPTAHREAETAKAHRG